MKALVFDMDGTIANLYAVDGWRKKIDNWDVSPYVNAEPMYDMNMMAEVLNMLRENDYRVIVTSWLSKHGTKEYNAEVRKAKQEWLAKYNFPYDEIHLVKYGTPKANCTRHHRCPQILFDDNAEVRKSWHLGGVVDASVENILDILKDLAENKEVNIDHNYSTAQKNQMAIEKVKQMREKYGIKPVSNASKAKKVDADLELMKVLIERFRNNY